MFGGSAASKVRAHLHERATAALLYAAAKLRVPDVLAEGPLDGAVIAARLRLRPGAGAGC